MQAAAPVMREAAKRELDADGAARSRCILNVSSTSGTHGNAGQANYSTVRRWGMGTARFCSCHFDCHICNKCSLHLLRSLACSSGPGFLSFWGGGTKIEDVQ